MHVAVKHNLKFSCHVNVALIGTHVAVKYDKQGFFVRVVRNRLRWAYL